MAAASMAFSDDVWPPKLASSGIAPRKSLVFDAHDAGHADGNLAQGWSPFGRVLSTELDSASACAWPPLTSVRSEMRGLARRGAV